MYNYEELKEFVDHCHRCSLCQTRNHSVMGKGNLHGQILFIAEAPGRNDDRDGVPFTGKSGELSVRITREHGTFLERKNTWLTAVYHPSAVLRDPSKLPQMQKDFRKIKNLQDQLRSDFVSP